MTSEADVTPLPVPKKYAVKDVFYTVQGEGLNTGTPAVFVRFAGCNLWSGRPEDRGKGDGDCARWCDTDFFKGMKLTAAEIQAWMWRQAKHRIGRSAARPWCVLSGGEPALQIDDELLNEIASGGWRIAVETNGTVTNTEMEFGADHVCLSPKRGTKLRMYGAHELKVVVGPEGGEGPAGWYDEELLALERRGRWGALFVQPLDVLLSDDVESTVLHHPTLPDVAQQLSGRPAGELKLAADQPSERHRRAVKRCVDFVQRHPRWRLSLQTHKYIGLE